MELLILKPSFRTVIRIIWFLVFSLLASALQPTAISVPVETDWLGVDGNWSPWVYKFTWSRVLMLTGL
jgi:hypothetical protein